jgi:hypothetical protein
MSIGLRLAVATVVVAARRLATCTAAIACAWGITRWMPKTGADESGYAELNPLMGRNPS